MATYLNLISPYCSKLQIDDFLVPTYLDLFNLKSAIVKLVNVHSLQLNCTIKSEDNSHWMDIVKKSDRLKLIKCLNEYFPNLKQFRLQYYTGSISSLHAVLLNLTSLELLECQFCFPHSNSFKDNSLSNLCKLKALTVKYSNFLFIEQILSLLDTTFLKSLELCWDWHKTLSIDFIKIVYVLKSFDFRCLSTNIFQFELTTERDFFLVERLFSCGACRFYLYICEEQNFVFKLSLNSSASSNKSQQQPYVCFELPEQLVQLDAFLMQPQLDSTQNKNEKNFLNNLKKFRRFFVSKKFSIFINKSC